MQRARLRPVGTPVGGEPRGWYRRAGVWKIRACRRPKKTRESRRRAPMAPRVKPPSLLQFDGRALPFELLFEPFGFLLGPAFLHPARPAFTQVPGLFQAQGGGRSALLYDLDLL